MKEIRDIRNSFPALGARYVFDGVPIVKLNPSQLAVTGQIASMIESRRYSFEFVDCRVCGSMNFELLATKDRYGNLMPVSICRDCGLVQTNPRMDQASYDDFYASSYRKLYSGASTMARFFDAQYQRGRAIFEYLSRRGFEIKGLSVLEVGCGAGGIIKYFRDRGNVVSGIDLDLTYLEYGASRHGLDLRLGRLQELRMDGTPDLVIYSHVMEHLLDPAGELRLLGELTGGDTILYLEVPGIRGISKNYYMDFLRYLQNAHTCHYTLTALTNLLRLTGYEMVHGDEYVRGIAKRQQGRRERLGPVNEYADTMAFLLGTERMRKYFPLHVPGALLKRSASAALEKAGLYKAARSLASRLKS